MFKNYCLSAMRHFTRYQSFTIINMVCLAMGLAFSLVIMVYILQQQAVNTGLKNVNNHYLLKSEWKSKGMGMEITTFGPLAKRLRNDYPSLVANYYRYNPVTNIISANNRYFKEDIAIGDTSFVTMYNLPVLYGNQQKAFTHLHTAVITETMAMKLFDRKNVLDEVISMQTTTGAKQDYTVSAVLKDLSYNSVTGILGDRYGVFVPAESSLYYSIGDPMQGWNGPNEIGFIELQPDVTASDLQQPILQLLKANLPEGIEKVLHVVPAPVRDYYLQSDNSKMQRLLNTLGMVAAFILAMAVINFVNINTGASAYRAKEIGVRKVLGGSKWAIMVQYLIEALLLTCLSALLALVAYEVLLPFANRLLLTTLPHVWRFAPACWAKLLLLVTGIGLLAGVYPAFVLSNMNIVLSVNGKTGTGKSGTLLRKVLLAVQFAVAIGVFIGALTVSKQVNYCFNKDLGYNKEQMMVIYAMPKQWDSAGVLKIEAVKKALQQNPAVRNASVTFEVPDRLPPMALPFEKPGGNAAQPMAINTISTDEAYAATLGLQVKEGRFFKPEKEGYTPGELVLNESAVKALGLQEPIGKSIRAGGNAYTIAGVVKDFNYSSLNEQIAPLVFTHVNDSKLYRFVTVKLASGNIEAAVASVKSTWKQMLPQSPFEYFFMDEKFQALYQSELQLKNSSQLATVLTIIIVLLGIFGVVSFAIVKRSREMALRKVLGAPDVGIILLFLKEYAGLFVIANLVTWPLAYYFTHQWLQSYVYRVQQGTGPYVTASLGLLVVSVVLIALQCGQITRKKPASGLQSA